MEITNTTTGAHVSGAPLSTSITRQGAPGLLRNAIDDRIVRVRPMATPLDQLSRCAGARSCNAMKVNYYSVDVKPTKAKLRNAITMDSVTVIDEDVTVTIDTDNNGIFSPSETLLISGSSTMDKDGNPTQVMLYVESVDRNKGVTARWINAVVDDGACFFDDIPAGLEVVRMGRAATELDVQTAQFEALPKKAENFCQIFKMQVEQSTFQRLANKEVGWNFSDQEEVAVIDMRQGMEKNFLFGTKAVITDHAKNEEVYLTGGIWNQTNREYHYNPGQFKADDLIDLMRQAFTGNGSGAAKKILIGGSGLIEALSKMEYTKHISAGETFAKWGIQFNELRSNFGSLYVLHSEIFDQCGHENDGFVLDPDYLTKYVHVPFHTEELNLRTSGVRNTDAIVITEASCLVLRHPDAHLRVIGI